MKWILLILILAMVAVVVMTRLGGQVSARDAVQYVKQGAVVIDVRTEEEFNAGHLAVALNIPLDRIETALPAKGIGKERVLLLHCRSGMRSMEARRRLQGQGYQNVFNLGSYTRAQQILGTGG